jgi:hypothetical protein
MARFYPLVGPPRKLCEWDFSLLIQVNVVGVFERCPNLVTQPPGGCQKAPVCVPPIDW